MVWLTGFLTTLLGNVIRPILREEIQSIKNWIQDNLAERKRFEAFDKEASEIIQQAQNASTVEEVNALLSRLNAARPTLK